MNIIPGKMADWEIAEFFEKSMLTITELGEKLNLQSQELLPFGHYMEKLIFIVFYNDTKILQMENILL